MVVLVVAVEPVEVVTVVAVVDVVAAGSSFSTSSTNASTLFSIDCASALVAHPPVASALANFAANFSSAFARHALLTCPPASSALAWHRSLAAAFLPVSVVFTAAHFSPGLAPQTGPARDRATRDRATNATAAALRAIVGPS